MLQLLGDPTINTEPNADTFDLYQDLDLIVLGADYSDYRHYLEQIQKEFTHMDDASYRNMRLRVKRIDCLLIRFCDSGCVNEKSVFLFPDTGNILDNTTNLLCTIHSRQIRRSGQSEYHSRNNGIAKMIFFLLHWNSTLHSMRVRAPHRILFISSLRFTVSIPLCHLLIRDFRRTFFRIVVFVFRADGLML